MWIFDVISCGLGSDSKASLAKFALSKLEDFTARRLQERIGRTLSIKTSKNLTYSFLLNRDFTPHCTPPRGINASATCTKTEKNQAK